VTISNFPTREHITAQIPEQIYQYVGGVAVPFEPSPTGAEQSFILRSPEELLSGIQAIAQHSDLEISQLDYNQQPSFSHIVHDVLNKYYQAQHKFEWESGIDNSIAPPLPQQWVSSRLTKYYEMAYKGDSDKVRQNNIKSDRKKFLPVAIDMANALPEISTAMDIQILLDDAGHELAADSVSDLLVVYGITIHLLREKQAKLQLEKQAKADRAAKAILSAELLQ